MPEIKHRVDRVGSRTPQRLVDMYENIDKVVRAEIAKINPTASLPGVLPETVAKLAGVSESTARNRMRDLAFNGELVEVGHKPGRRARVLIFRKRA